LFYLTAEYEAAVQGFGTFLEQFPESDFSANALYWTGEALFELGQLAESRRFFEEVTERYPTSYRVEAARYRQDVIDLEQREDELLTLMQWSHEEYLSALEEFRQKEIAYQEALQSYRDRLSSLAEEDFQQEIEVLTARVSELEDALALKDEQINELLAELRQAEARADALLEISAAAAARQTVAEEEPAPVADTPATTPVGTAAETPAETPPPATTTSVQEELLSLRDAAVRLQQRLLQEGSEE
jgi:TolA-binding protein